MSGPYPPQGYPQQPAQGGWGGQVGGGPSGPYGPSNYPGGWQQQQRQDQPAWNAAPQPDPTPPPPRKHNTGQLVIAIIASLVIIGGVVTGIVLLNGKHAQQQANPGTTTPTATSQQQPQDSNQPGATNASGSTTLAVSAGQCVTVKTTANSNSYAVTKTAQCGTTSSDFVLNKTVGQISGCAAQQYVVITGPSGAVYCFTIDVKAGDCVDNYYLKVACGAQATYAVIKTEAGPGGAASCRNVVGVQRWVPAGYPAAVACIGPPGSS
ncbi:MAG TPA: hypothetical protein VGM75_23180 [Pseudonocardiaceae bacterium]